MAIKRIINDMSARIPLTTRLIKVEPHELPAAVMSFLFIFILMASYYLLRPVRDAMASDWTNAELSWLWTLNFFISAAAVLLYGQVVSRIELRRLVPGIYSSNTSLYRQNDCLSVR